MVQQLTRTLLLCSRLCSASPFPANTYRPKVLEKGPDVRFATTLQWDAVGDESWLVRAAALEALSKRGDPSVLNTVELYMSDEKDPVKYTAAATVLRLTAIKEAQQKKLNKRQR